MTSVEFINNEGGGFSDEINVQNGTTAAQLFVAQMGADKDAGEYLIRVNRTAVPASYVLQGGDRMTVTPTKIDGAL